MPLTVGVLKENLEGETRVALTPEITGKLQKLGVSVVMESGAGDGSQIPDDEYADVSGTYRSLMKARPWLVPSVAMIELTSMLLRRPSSAL